MNQTLKILMLCLAFILIMTRVFSLLHRSAGGRMVPTMVVPDSSNYPRDTFWTAAYRKHFADHIYKWSDTLLVLPQQRTEFAGCIVSRFKRLFPNGLKGISKDSLKLLAQRAYGSCLISLPDTALLRFTNYQQQVLRRQLYTKLTLTNWPKDKRTGYCDCIVSALQVRYASGIRGKVASGIIKSTGDSCATKVLLK